MRIALDARTIQDHFPGIARYTFNLAQALADCAPQAELFLLHDPAQRNTRFDLSPLTVKANVRLMPVHAGAFSPSAQWRVPRLLSQLRADLYHSPYYLMPYVTQRPTIVTVYDLIPLLYPHYFTPTQCLIFQVAMCLAIRAAHCVIAISQATARDLQKWLHVPSQKLAIIPLAADPALRRPAAEVIASVRGRYQLPASYVLYVGSNKPHKNLTRLVQAFTGLNVPLVIAGHWEERYPQAKQLAARLGLHDAVRWLGPVPQGDLPALYAGALAFAFPSEYEGFGLPMLEAMACGTPVICSNASALREVAGHAALLVSPYDDEGWRAAIERVLTDEQLRARLSAQGLQRAGQFSWTTVAQQTYAQYQQLTQTLVKS